MIVNIYGSTGIIGKQALSIIKNNFPKYKVNLICAKNNIKLLVNQSKIFKVKYVYLDNPNKFRQLKSLLPKDIKVCVPLDNCNIYPP